MSRPDIDQAVARMTSKFGAKKELRELPSQLWDQERVLHLATGFYGGGNGLLVVTDQRILFFFKGVIRTVSEDFLYDKISSIEFKSGMVLASISVFVSNQKAEIEQLDKGTAKQIVDDVRGILANRQSATPPAASSASPDAADQLLKLKQLHDAGILDSAEYESKRQTLIARL